MCGFLWIAEEIIVVLVQLVRVAVLTALVKFVRILEIHRNGRPDNVLSLLFLLNFFSLFLIVVVVPGSILFQHLHKRALLRRAVDLTEELHVVAATVRAETGNQIVIGFQIFQLLYVTAGQFV